MRRWLGVALIFALLLLPTGARAQVVPERELEIAKALFDAGNYQEALKRARDAMSTANFSDEQRLELHRIAGLSAFNLSDLEGAQRHFLLLLQVNPDYVLDPFAAPPPAIKLFEKVRQLNHDALSLIRQQLALRAAEEKRALEDRERARLEQDAQRRRVDELTRSATVRVIERRSFLMNFVPFGVGQFQQGRFEWGVTLAVVEAVTALTSLISYFAIEGLYTDTGGITLHNVLTSDGTGTYTVHYRHIPESAAGQAAVWNTLKLATGIAFYALWAFGIGDAIWHHTPEVITEHQEAVPAAKISIAPTPGGLSAGLTLSF
jgi:tetratricopeptide (TPR) repeat protein